LIYAGGGGRVIVTESLDELLMLPAASLAKAYRVFAPADENV
jgi:hypothetical protein